MRTHRIHLPLLKQGTNVVTGKEAVHLAQVLRAAPGSLVRAFDGRGNEAEGEVLEVEPGRLVIGLREARRAQVEAGIAVTVAVGLLKGDKLADVVRQCTELGAVAFRPLLTKRRDVDMLSVNKLERLRRVAGEAAKQSGRSLVPAVAEPVTLAGLELEELTLVAHPGAEATLLTAVGGILAEVRASERSEKEQPGREPERAALESGPPRVMLITGPEGGFTPDEVLELESRGARAVRLGARVLRAETAPAAVLAALLLPEAL